MHIQIKPFLILLALVFTAMNFSSCLHTEIPPTLEESYPVILQPDEKEIWERSDRMEQFINNSQYVYEDQELETYLHQIAQQLLNQTRLSQTFSPRIKVLLEPSCSAFILPNGAMYLHSGILAQIENEAQLATIIGHELTHFTHRHALRESRTIQNAEQTANILTFLTGGLGRQAFQLWELSSLSGFSKELELEADTEGLHMVVNAGYDPHQTIQVFEHLLTALQELGIEEPLFFSSHPRLQERITNYQKLVNIQQAKLSNADIPKRPIRQYTEAVHNLLLDNVAMNIDYNQFESAQKSIDRILSRFPTSARGYFLRGEIQRKNTQGLDKAMASYQTALHYDKQFANAYKEMGLIHRQLKRDREAQEAFKTYLSLTPDAYDAPIIQSYINEPNSS